MTSETEDFGEWDVGVVASDSFCSASMIVAASKRTFHGFVRRKVAAIVVDRLGGGEIETPSRSRTCSARSSESRRSPSRSASPRGASGSISARTATYASTAALREIDFSSSLVPPAIP